MQITSYNGNIWTYSPERNVLHPGEQDVSCQAHETCPSKVILPYTISSMQKLCGDYLNEMILCLTENCNMHCKYCTYCDSFPHMRNFSTKTMSIETGKAAIDWLESHSRKSPSVNISFFGGEPLLEFPVLRALYEYASTLFHDRTLSFMVSTNGTLFNESFLLWLKNIDNFDVTITLNGPAEIHDHLRVYKSGGGTHEKILTHLPKLQEALNYDSNRLKIQCNYRDYRDVLAQHQYFSSEDLFKYAKIFYTKISLQDNFSKENQDIKILPEYVDRVFEKKIRIKAIQHAAQSNLLPPSSLWATSLIPQFAREMNKRVQYSVIGHQGCCSPLFARVNIDVDGNIFLCEKSDNTPILGNVNKNGVDWCSFAQLIDDCNSLFESLQCKDCHAIFYCQVCYNHFYEDGRLKPLSQIKKACKKMCRLFSKDLSWYCSLLEACPHIKIAPQDDPDKSFIIELTKKSALEAIVNSGTNNCQDHNKREKNA